MSEKDNDSIQVDNEQVSNKVDRKKGIKKVATNELPKKSLEESLAVIKPIHETYAGGLVSWDELASSMGVGAKSNNTKYLIWSAQAYDLIIKEGDKFKLSETGRKIISPTHPDEYKDAIIKAIRIPTILSKFYSDYDGKLIPDDEYFGNVLETRYNIPRDRLPEAERVILNNADFAGILISHANEKKTIRFDNVQVNKSSVIESDHDELSSRESVDLLVEEVISPTKGASICFYITPIGEDGSAERKHADMLLKHLVEPVFSQCGIEVVRADKISKSGLISQQIFEYIISSRFCIADLSFGNPNAFYELGVRHMTKLPTIQLIRKGDKIPFDVAQGRTIVIDVSDIYTIMDKIDSAKKELLEHIRNYNESEQNKVEDNPISIYLPGLQVKLPKLT
ncbi:hypothetical protein [Pectobacterium jejuense]|uniref:Uncharacterized protein n=1 Tax=Pectobacterium jejuense TaxID=2974022 RepID=A0ABW8GSG2_9GAMM